MMEWNEPCFHCNFLILLEGLLACNILFYFIFCNNTAAAMCIMHGNLLLIKFCVIFKEELCNIFFKYFSFGFVKTFKLNLD